MVHVNSGVDGEVIAVEALKRSEIPVLDDGIRPEWDVSVVTYWSQGLKVKAYLVVPTGEAGKGRDGAGTWPGLMYCRGGIRRVGMVQLPRMMTLAKRGYAVMAPVYRGNLGGDGYEDFGGEDRYDVFHALRAMRSFPFVKPEPISMIGFSRGAMMALLAAVHCREEVGPVAVWGGVSDLRLTYEERVDLRRMLRRVVGHPKKQPDEYLRRSPIHMADQIHSPVLIVHGTEDVQVGVKHAHLLAGELERAKKVYAMRLYAGEGHEFPAEIDKDALDTIFAWFAKHRTASKIEDVAVKAGNTGE